MLAVAFIQATVVSPGDVAALLAYTPAHGRWWTVFTHPLVHAGIWTALANAFVIAAYMAEAVRGGLQALLRGRHRFAQPDPGVQAHGAQPLRPLRQRRGRVRRRLSCVAFRL